MNSNTKDIKDLQEDGVVSRITATKLYERVIRLETKLDLIGEDDRHSRTIFYWISAVMIILEVLVLVVHLLYAAS